MKRSLIASIILAGAGLGSSAAMAQEAVGGSRTPLELVDLSAYFGDAFGPANQGDIFDDRFTFTVDNPSGLHLDAMVASISRSGDTGLDITGLTLYGANDAVVTTGQSLRSGAVDLWTVAGNNLAPGDYYLQVTGELLSEDSASYAGTMGLAPVPEPATYALVLGGLGVLGLLAQRRRAKRD